MESISAFLNMGGHAAFVWPALGLTAVILIVMAVASTRQLRASETALRIAEEASGGRRRPRAGTVSE